MSERMKESTGVLRDILEKFISGEVKFLVCSNSLKCVASPPKNDGTFISQTPSIDMRNATLSSIKIRRYSRLIYYANAMKKK